MLAAVGALSASAEAAPLAGVLATDASNGPIAAYSNTAAWSRWDPAVAGYRLVVDRGGAIRTLAVPPSSRPFEVTAGRGPDGATWLVWARCAGDSQSEPTACDIEGYDLGTDRPKTFPFAARADTMERAPAINGTRMVYVTGLSSGVARVHLRHVDGSGDRIVSVLPRSTCALSIDDECFAVTRTTPLASALRGSRLAVASRVSTTTGGDVGICGLASVRLLHLDTRAVRTLDTAVCGLSGQGMRDVAFDADSRLWWRQSCSGDASACQGTRGGPFRQTASGLQRLMTGVGSRLSGIAVATRTPVVGARAAGSPPGCFITPLEIEYRCGTVTAFTTPSFAAVSAPRQLPPSGYVTVRGTSRVRLLSPPATIACSRGDIRPRPGATLWAGASWVNGRLRVAGPAVPVSARSGGRTLRDTIPGGTAGQQTARIVLGGPSHACGRTWTLTYRPPGAAPISFTTRVLAR